MAELNLGSQTNKALVSRLKTYLDNHNAVLIKHNWGMAGSVEIETWLFYIDNQEIKIEVETYEGITVFGSPEILDQLKSYIKK